MPFYSADKEAFRACPETCPKVDRAANIFETEIIKDFEHMLSNHLKNFREVEQEARDDMRSALISAYERIGELETQLGDALKENEKLQSDLEDAHDSEQE